MSARIERNKIIRSGSPLSHHSLNQQKIRRTLEGERYFGILKVRKTNKDELDDLIGSLKDNNDFTRLLSKATELEIEKQTIPRRIGVISLTITSIINGELKERGEQFVEEAANLLRLKFNTGSPLQKLIPVNLMVNNYLLETRQIPANLNLRKQVYEAANLFAQNFGGLMFFERPEETALIALVATNNIARHLSREIAKNRLDILVARKILVCFGQTVNRELTRI